MKIFSQAAAVRLISQSYGRFVSYVGAGVSAESDVKTADAICLDILERLAGDPTDSELIQRTKDALDWGNPATRYAKCIAMYGNQSHRVQYFKEELSGKPPSFAHYALAMLAESGVLKRTLLTTNFDKLIESAFVRLGSIECQAIRTDVEQNFIDLESDKAYVLKLHGDYDTYNIRNTTSELLYIQDALERRVVRSLRGAGIVVLGSSGFEESIQRLFGSISRAMSEDAQILGYGLLWGVFVPGERPESISDDDFQAHVERSVSPRMIEIIKEADRNNDLCGFFPVWGAGEFLHRLIEATCERETIAKAEVHLSHPMRLRRVLRKSGVTSAGVDRHMAALERARAKIGDGGASTQLHERIASLADGASALTVELHYGDISSHALLATGTGMSAVVSPDDTLISAGGGVALALLKGAGVEYMLNELAKHQPLDQDGIAVTSAGELPLHYVIHTAALRIEIDGEHAVSTLNVERTVANVLRKAACLGVSTIWLPLIAAGGAGTVTAEQSLAAIGRSLAVGKDLPLCVRIVVFKDSILNRAQALQILDAELAFRQSPPS